MATIQQYIKLKKELKRLAFTNRRNKNLLKNAQREGNYSWPKTGQPAKHFWKYTRARINSRYEFRHKHIIASLLRGKTRDQIEPYVRYGNKPNSAYLQKLSEEYEIEKGIEREAYYVAEIVCS